MDLIRDIADWLATGWGDRLGIFFPLVLVGLLGLYLLWLVIGYLRVSQVGIADRAASQPVVALPSGGDELPRGVPYCPFDQLQFPLGARFCTELRTRPVTRLHELRRNPVGRRRVLLPLRHPHRCRRHRSPQLTG